MENLNEIFNKVLQQNSILWLAITFFLGIIGGLVGGGVKFLFEVLLPESHKTNTLQKNIYNKYSHAVLKCADEAETRLSIILSYGIKYDWLSLNRIDNIKTGDNYLKTIIEEKGYFFMSTLYIIGQYFAWLKIIEKENGYPQFPKNKKIKRFYKIINRINSSFKVVEIFGVKYNEIDGVNDNISLYSYLQSSIGDLMVSENEGKFSLISFKDFVDRYKDDSEFRQWFRNVEKYFEGLSNIDIEKLPQLLTENKEFRLARLILIQYWFFQLIKFIDPQYNKVKPRSSNYEDTIIQHLPDSFKLAIKTLPENHVSLALSLLKNYDTK